MPLKDSTLEKTLQNRQHLLTFIQEYYGRKRIPPTLTEMADEIYGDKNGAGNVSVQLVDPLIAEGFLYRVNEGKYLVRNIMLTQPQPRAVYYQESEKVT